MILYAVYAEICIPHSEALLKSSAARVRAWELECTVTASGGIRCRHEALVAS
jgi:hypothetical protein